jgi:hypothetical protein
MSEVALPIKVRLRSRLYLASLFARLIFLPFSLLCQNGIGDGGLYTLFAGLLALACGVFVLLGFKVRCLATLPPIFFQERFTSLFLTDISVASLCPLGKGLARSRSYLPSSE